jgi:hypothetical protein
VQNALTPPPALVRSSTLTLASLLLLWCTPCFLLSGCVSKTRAKAEAQKAFVAGQQEAMMRLQHARGPSVTVSGQVKNPFVPWSSETTLAKAILEANYCGPADPKEILILRKGQQIPVDVQRLLSGEDVPLEAGDVVYLK